MTVARNDSGLRLVGLGVEPPLWMRLQVVKLLELLNGGQLDSRVRRRREEVHQTRTQRRGGALISPFRQMDDSLSISII